MTLEAAILEALEVAAEIAPGQEAGTAIYQCGDTYLYEPPVTQGKRDRVDIPVYQMAGCTLAALVHTHPKGDTTFSRADVAGICGHKVVGAILPIGGTVQLFDCRNVSYAVLQSLLNSTRPVKGKDLAP